MVSRSWLGVRFSFIAKTLEAQRKSIEQGGQDENHDNDTDEEIEQGMAKTKDRLAKEFEEKAEKKVCAALQ